MTDEHIHKKTRKGSRVRHLELTKVLMVELLRCWVYFKRETRDFKRSHRAPPKNKEASAEMAGNDVTQIVIPLKYQDSANEQSLKLQITAQLVSVSRIIGQNFQECETKPQLAKQNPRSVPVPM